ncbi:MAG: hypothetical protein R3D84_00680 [Paracoccaceae bacterium]
MALCRESVTVHSRHLKKRRKMMRLFLSALVAFALAAPGIPKAGACPVVQLPADFTIGDLQGTAPAEGFVCYDVRFPMGQNLSIELVSGRNVSVTVPGYYDDRVDRMFLGDLPGQLEIRVFQLMRAATPQDFSVRIRFEAPGNG